MSDPWIPAQQTAPGQVWNPKTAQVGAVAVITVTAPAGSVPMAVFGVVVQIDVTAPAGTYVEDAFSGWGVPIF